jgi:hypothetical protein
LAKTWQFQFFLPEVLHICLNSLKIKETLKNFKNSQRLLSYYFPLCGTTFSQNQTSATAPLKMDVDLKILKKKSVNLSKFTQRGKEL